jgi:hypothetical protein
MKNSTSAVIRFAAASCLLGMLSSVHAAPTSPEDRYIATRDAAIKKISKLYDDKNGDEAAKAEKAADADLVAQMKAILAEPDRKGFGPPKLNIDAYSEGDEGFGMLDGLRIESLTGENGEKAGAQSPDKYVEPRAHIIVTTQSLLERWLRSHKDWWDKNAKNVAQQTAAALKQEEFYTQAISTDSAVVSFNELPITPPPSATHAVALLGGRTQDAVPDADSVFVSAVANGKAYVAYESIKPKVQVPACTAIKAEYNKKAEKAADDFNFKRIDKKAYDKLPDFRQQGEDAYKKCFTERAPQEPSFVEATKQAQALLAEAIGK